MCIRIRSSQRCDDEMDKVKHVFVIQGKSICGLITPEKLLEKRSNVLDDYYL